jgi:hypothetical protein
MARIDGVFNDFSNHVTSGLSRFIFVAYRVCELAQTSALVVKLLPEVDVPEPFSGETWFIAHVQDLRDKFVEILAKHLNLSSLETINSLTVEVDFAPDSARVEKQRQIMASVPTYYGYDPVYRCTVSMEMTSGRTRIIVQER